MMVMRQMKNSDGVTFAAPEPHLRPHLSLSSKSSPARPYRSSGLSSANEIADPKGVNDMLVRLWGAFHIVTSSNGTDGRRR